MPGERLDRAVELPREPARGLLAGRPDRRVELDGRLLGQPRGLARNRMLDLVDQAPLDVAERLADLATLLRELSLDLLRERALAIPQAVGDLVQGAPSFGGVGLELARCRVVRLLDLPLDLGPQPRERERLSSASDDSRSVSRAKRFSRPVISCRWRCSSRANWAASPSRRRSRSCVQLVILPSNSFWAATSRVESSVRMRCSARVISSRRSWVSLRCSSASCAVASARWTESVRRSSTSRLSTSASISVFRCSCASANV